MLVTARKGTFGHGMGVGGGWELTAQYLGCARGRLHPTPLAEADVHESIQRLGQDLVYNRPVPLPRSVVGQAGDRFGEHSRQLVADTELFRARCKQAFTQAPGALRGQARERAQHDLTERRLRVGVALARLPSSLVVQPGEARQGVGRSKLGQLLPELPACRRL